MDDISSQLNRILSDPQSMAQIQGIMSGLGLGENSAPATSSTPTTTPSTPLTPPPSTAPATQGMPDANMIGMLTQLAPLLNSTGQDDDSSRLLSALKPMLSEKRAEKIDQALKILQLMRLFPVLKDSGMLQSVLGGLF